MPRKKEYVGSRVRKSRGDDVMATQAAAEPQETDMAEGGAGEQQEEPAVRMGDEQEAPGMGQVAEAPAAVDAGEEPEARGARLFFVLEKPYFDVMVSGEKTVEYREKKRTGSGG